MSSTNYRFNNFLGLFLPETQIRQLR